MNLKKITLTTLFLLLATTQAQAGSTWPGSLRCYRKPTWFGQKDRILLDFYGTRTDDMIKQFTITEDKSPAVAVNLDACFEMTPTSTEGCAAFGWGPYTWEKYGKTKPVCSGVQIETIQYPNGCDASEKANFKTPVRLRIAFPECAGKPARTIEDDFLCDEPCGSKFRR